MSDTDCAPLSWENQLFGRASASRQRGMAAFDRWKRATLALSISAELWARRDAEESALPTQHGQTDHVALVLDDNGVSRGRGLPFPRHGSRHRGADTSVACRKSLYG